MSKIAKETTKQIDVFEYYYSMDRRSMKAAAEHFKMSEGTVRDWAMRFHWQQRVEDRAERERLEKEKAYLNKIKERTEIHQRSYQLVQGKAIEYIGKDRPKGEDVFNNAGDAVKALDIGIKGEREVIGLTSPAGTGVINHTTNIQNNITVALEEMAKNGSRETILRSLKRVYKELTEGNDKKTT